MSTIDPTDAQADLGSSFQLSLTSSGEAALTAVPVRG
jgi:hypothetical protein